MSSSVQMDSAFPPFVVIVASSPDLIILAGLHVHYVIIQMFNLDIPS